MTDLSAVNNTQVTQERNIQTVTAEIRTLSKQAGRVMLDYAVEIGRRLVEAKEMLGHGEWGPWLETEAEFSQSTANNFMRLFEEYGDQQIGLFGEVSNSQTFGNLTYTKALKLIALPETEREQFVNDNDVESMSTRELQQAIKERDEAIKAKEQAELDKADAESERSALDEKLQAANDNKKNLEEREAALKKQIEDLKKKPIEAAEPDPEEIDKVKKEAAAEAKKKAEDSSKKQIEKLEEELSQLRQDKKETESVAKKTAEALEAAKAEAERAKKQSAIGSREVVECQVLFGEFQESYNKLHKKIEAVAKDSPDVADNILKATVVQLSSWVEKLTKEAEKVT